MTTASDKQTHESVSEGRGPGKSDRTVVAAEQEIAQATVVHKARSKRKGNGRSREFRMPSDPEVGDDATGLAAFAAHSKGSLAPWWLLRGVCDAWGFDTFTTEVRLISVSENASFLVIHNDNPYGVIRVSQPGYVGGPVAVASEIAWINALHSLKGVNVVDNIPTASGFTVATITDEAGTEWSCMCMAFVEGTILEDMPDLSSYYRDIGRWAALFHAHSRSWHKPDGFRRFEWGLADMVGEHPRWGRWEDTELAPEEFDVLKRAEQEALNVMEDVPRIHDTWGLIHADLRPSNIISGDDGTLTVIDFDDCGFSYFLYDYAVALSFVEHESSAPEMAREWIAGYQEIAPLSDDDLSRASALSMIRRLQMLGWTTTHLADSLPEGLYEAQRPGTVYCANRYIQNPLWLLRDDG